MKRPCPAAKSVSKAREDLPEPETPVMTVTRSWGRAREMFFRLFCLAPSMRSQRGWGIGSDLLRCDSIARSRRGAIPPLPLPLPRAGERRRGALTAPSPREGEGWGEGVSPGEGGEGGGGGGGRQGGGGPEAAGR